jgi:membrane protease YdiL (CAAX protease family)
MPTEVLGILETAAIDALLFVPLILVTWLVTKRHKATDLKTDFANPRMEALLSIVVVLSITLILTTYLFSVYQSVGGPAGTPSKFYLWRALFQWGIYGVLFIFPVFAVTKLRHQALETVGITKKNAWFSTGLGIVLAFGLSVFVTPIISDLIKVFTSSAFYGFFYFLAVGFGEELLFRGYLQTRCISWLGALRGLVLASVIMALMHLPQRIFAVGFDPLQALASAVSLIPISLTLGYLMLRAKNTLGPAIMHAILDWISSIV